MKDNSNQEIIDIRKIVLTIIRHKNLFFKVWIVTIILASVYIFPIPRTYESEVILAPESSNSASLGSLSSLASSFGFDIGSMAGEDAIYPVLYPDLISSNEFLAKILSKKIKSDDGLIECSYYEYLVKHQKCAFYKIPYYYLREKIKSLGESDEPTNGNATNIDPFRLTKKEFEVITIVSDLISCDIDKKTDVITISVVDQDPYIAACMADSVRIELQEAIIRYRTKKAYNDLVYYESLMEESLANYQSAAAKYGQYADSHNKVVMQGPNLERDMLEKEMNFQYSSYSAINAQVSAARARLQERTPAFTIISGASVPIKPSGPKRVLFIIFMLFLASLSTVVYIYRKQLFELMTQIK